MIERSIVVVSRGRRRWLREAVAALAQSLGKDPQAEILVIEETDAPMAVPWPEIVRYHTIPEKGLGFGHVRQLALELARGRWIAFVDDDVRVAPDWAGAIFAPLREGRWAVVGGAVLPECERIGTIGRVISLLGFPGGGIGRCIEAGGIPTRSAEISTSNCAFQADAARAVGGFDVTLRWGGEDSDFFARLAAKSETGFDPQAIVWHRQRDTMAGAFAWFVRRGRADFFLQAKRRGAWRAAFIPLRSSLTLKIALCCGLVVLAGGVSSVLAASLPAAWIGAQAGRAMARRRRWRRLLRSHPDRERLLPAFQALDRPLAWLALVPVKWMLDAAFEIGRLGEWGRVILLRLLRRETQAAGTRDLFGPIPAAGGEPSRQGPGARNQAADVG